MSTNEEWNRQLDQIQDRRNVLMNQLRGMAPVSWRQNAVMNEVPVWSTKQKREREEMVRELKELNAAERALLGH